MKLQLNVYGELEDAETGARIADFRDGDTSYIAPIIEAVNNYDVLRAAAELAFTELEEQMDPMDYDDGPPASVCAAYDALFKALDKAPAPETNDDGSTLPL